MLLYFFALDLHHKDHIQRVNTLFGHERQSKNSPKLERQRESRKADELDGRVVPNDCGVTTKESPGNTMAETTSKINALNSTMSTFFLAFGGLGL